MDVPRQVSEFRRRHRWAAAVLLGAAGFLLNLRPIPLSPGTDLLFGVVPSLLAAIALGAAPGALAAAIASSRTLVLWNHPWAWLIFTLEALVVGILARRYGRRPLVADLLFWVGLGVPLLFATYYLGLGVRGAAAAVIFLKQPFNGLISALLAEGLLLLPAVRRALGVRGAPQLRSALAVVVALSATLPALAFGLWTGAREWDRNLEGTRERLKLSARAHAARLEEYVGLHADAVRSVAGGPERRADFDADQLQRLVAAERQEFPGFVNVFAADARGRVVAIDPPADRSGRPLAGLDFSDRAYFQDLATRRETVVSAVFAGRGGTDDPLVGIAHPIVLGDTLAGFVLGALDLRRLPRPSPTPADDERLLVVDSLGTVVYDSRREYAPGERPRSLADSASFQAVRAVELTGTTTYPERPAAVAAASVSGARMLAGVSRMPLGWWVWVEQPYSTIQAFVADSYVRLLSILIAVTLLALALSNLLSTYLARPLLRMRGAAAALGAGDHDARVGALPAIAPDEVHELGRDFDRMADALSGRAEELELLGEIARSLASTLDSDEVLQRVTDAAVRLVDPDGAGIALLTPGGQTLRAADYSLGILFPVAGKEVPADRSLIGWVSRHGEPVLIRDAAADERVHREYVDPETMGSVVCAPLTGRSGPLGTLACVRNRERPPFTEADLRLLERLARHAAVAVENAHLVALERRRAEESEAIRTVARTVSAVQGLQETLAVITREAARIVDAEACRVKLLREDGMLEVVATSGPAGMSVGTVLPVRGPLLEGPVLRGEPVTITDGENAAAVPLKVGDETLGVLTAHDRATPFAPDDAALLVALADHAAIALRNARLLDAAQAASRAKSDFIATMSHELRTPLNAVLGHLQLLEMEIHGKLSERQREALGRIEAASRHLRGLIEEVLSFARLEAGRTETRIEETDLCALAKEVAAVIEPLALEKELRFAAELADPPVVVPTDPDKVRQVLINLAGNAVKFTGAGEVRVTVRERGDEAVLAVHDTGPGIAREDQARLFRPFEQLESGFSRPHGGTGLGLYLSGQYAGLLGGRIDVESEEGKGSTFSLVLPKEGPAAGREAEAAAAD